MTQTPSPSGPPPVRPPELLAIILILCGLTIVLDLVASILGFAAIFTHAKGAPSPVSTTTILISALVRIVGAIRLYTLKADSWIYLLISLLVGASANLLVYVEQTLTRQPAPTVLSMVVSLVIPTVIVVYAFRATNQPRKG